MISFNFLFAIHEKYFWYKRFKDLKLIVYGNTNSLSQRIVSYSLFFKTALHLCQLNYLFVAKQKHATDVRNDGVTYLLHPLNNPLTTLKPQYSIKCETLQVITAMDWLINFTMSQRSDRHLEFWLIFFLFTHWLFDK